MSEAPVAPGELCSEAQELLHAMALVEGDVLLYEDDVELWRERLAAVPEGRRETVALDLLAVAGKLQREAGDAAESAVVQLSELVSVLLLSDTAATALFENAGLFDAARASGVTGAEAPSKRPASDGGPAGKGSLFALRIGNKGR
ncbi:MAG: hypothetical protein ABIJ09_23905 [Pseudomonadota bacterium]